MEFRARPCHGRFHSSKSTVLACVQSADGQHLRTKHTRMFRDVSFAGRIFPTSQIPKANFTSGKHHPKPGMPTPPKPHRAALRAPFELPRILSPIRRPIPRDRSNGCASHVRAREIGLGSRPASGPQPWEGLAPRPMKREGLSHARSSRHAHLCPRSCSASRLTDCSQIDL